MSTRLIAYYLPQFHETQENNVWWGKGFTEWDNVKAATPLFPNHRQPRIPANGYYDLSEPSTIESQAKLAKQYGIEGFCIYDYWYSGTQLLQKPVQNILNNPNLQVNYCLCWANHSWTRSWKNRDGVRDILIAQTYERSYERRVKHYNYLLRCFSDPRYIQTNGKPIFQIYQPNSIPFFDEYISDLRSYIWSNAHIEIHVAALISGRHPRSKRKFLESIDSITLFQPGAAINGTIELFSDKVIPRDLKGFIRSAIRSAPLPVRKVLYKIQDIVGESHTILDYDLIWERILTQSEYANTYANNNINIDINYGAFVDFDNTPRYKDRAKLFSGVSPEKFKLYLKKLNKIARAKYGSPIIFINAWNEWGEGAYLEADTVNSFSMLEAVYEAIYVPDTVPDMT